jgi:hypothetical protein
MPPKLARHIPHYIECVTIEAHPDNPHNAAALRAKRDRDQRDEPSEMIPKSSSRRNPVSPRTGPGCCVVTGGWEPPMEGELQCIPFAPFNDGLTGDPPNVFSLIRTTTLFAELPAARGGHVGADADLQPVTLLSMERSHE